MEKSIGPKNAKHQLPRKPRPGVGTRRGPNTTEQVLKEEFVEYRQFLTDQAGRRGKDFRERIAAARVKDLLEHQLTMLRLTRQMNKLLNDLSSTETRNNSSHNNRYYATKCPSPPPPPLLRRKSKKLSSQANEYIIFSGGSRGLEYSSLKKSRTGGTFRMEVDVRDYEPEDVHIHTENNKTMHVKAGIRDSGVRKTLKIVSPAGIDIDDVIIHYPQHGILVLEAP